MHVYKKFLSQLNPKPGIFFQTKRGTAQSYQEISCLCQQAKFKPSTTYVYQRSTNYASKSWNLPPPHQDICRSGSGPCSSSCWQGRASEARMICISKAQCSSSGGRQQNKGLGGSYPERSLRGLPASSFSYLAKIYKMFYSQTSRKL